MTLLRSFSGTLPVMQFYGQVSGTGVAAEFHGTITNAKHFLNLTNCKHGDRWVLHTLQVAKQKDATNLIKVLVITINNLYPRPTMVASQRPAMVANTKSAHEQWQQKSIVNSCRSTRYLIYQMYPQLNLDISKHSSFFRVHHQTPYLENIRTCTSFPVYLGWSSLITWLTISLLANKLTLTQEFTHIRKKTSMDHWRSVLHDLFFCQMALLPSSGAWKAPILISVGGTGGSSKPFSFLNQLASKIKIAK